jgi:hypothetical protein
VRDRTAADALDVMPVDRLRDLVRGKVTFAPLIDGGVETVGQVLEAGPEALRAIPGVRRRTARRVIAAAAQMRESVTDGARVRIDPDARTVAMARKRLSRAEAELEKAAREQRATRLWNDYLARPVTYNGLLIEVAELDPVREASQGFLPADIVERVRVLPLDQSLLKTPLRGYQAFGAKFALVRSG